ncbi:MAG: DUF177 domain-containing protein [Deltaproteobacteria bacterium]|nr:DUF177 domain-containing protein [Deltaproteobacteria bacterium]
MKVDIRDILEEGLHLNIAENGSELQPTANKVDFLILSPVSANLTLLKSDEDVFVRGGMASVLKFSCARCLKEFEQKISSNIDVVYSIAPEHGLKEKELSMEETSINYLKGAEIDINAVLFEQLSLDIPMQPVCGPNCKGLCPKCGADLNQGNCGCHATDHTDTRFAKLKQLKLK